MYCCPRDSNPGHLNEYSSALKIKLQPRPKGKGYLRESLGFGGEEHLSLYEVH